MTGRSSTRKPSSGTGRRRDDSGYVAMLAAILVSSVFMALAAIGVDISRWYMEGERLQKAADAASLAGVTYMPGNFPAAQKKAIAVAAKNGYVATSDGRTTVVVSRTTVGSQLKVTIEQRVDNAFAASFGITSNVIGRSSVADFTPPTPIGSPCNVFGNEAPSQPTSANQPQPVGQPATGSALPSPTPSNCSSLPQIWGGVEGPTTDKVQGDRFGTTVCAAATPVTVGCTGGRNDEYRDEGYFFTVHVEPGAVGQSINVQIYDPAYVLTQIRCSTLPQAASISSNNINDYATTDAKDRYSAYEITDSSGNVTYRNTNAQKYCAGDYNPGGTAGNPPTTSYVLRQQIDEGDPQTAPAVPGCIKQFVGRTTFGSGELVRTDSTYNQQFARVFHQWVPLCTITGARAGDYYLQVRTNVTTAGGIADATTNGTTAMVYTGNPNVTADVGNTSVGAGLNAFSLRAVPGDDSKRQFISVAGSGDLPLLQNATASTAKFNLVRALPNTKDKKIVFDFYDAADGSGSSGGTIRVIKPSDATGSITSGSDIAGCTYSLNGASASSTSTCTAAVTNAANNGQIGSLSIPLPHDYNCDNTILSGCWFQVEIKFTGNVTDFTTWTARIVGDPIRIVE